MRIGFFASVLLCVAMMAPAQKACAQDLASARSFLESVFQLYSNHGKGINNGPRYLHSSLVSLIREDIKTMGTDVPGPLDGDLVCGCQEWDGIWILKMDVKSVNPQRAQAVVSFAVYEPKSRPKDDSSTFRYTLVPEHGQWRIYDVEYLSFPPEAGESKSLRGQLRNEIEFHVHPPKP